MASKENQNIAKLLIALVVIGWLLSSLTNGISEGTSELEELNEEVVDDSMEKELGNIGEAGSKT